VVDSGKSRLTDAAEFSGFSLSHGESIHAVLRPDLDERLTYGSGLVLLTNTHLRCRAASGEVTEIALSEGIELRSVEHHGLSELAVLRDGRTLARFHFTLRQQPSGEAAAHRSAHGAAGAVPAAGIRMSVGLFRGLLSLKGARHGEGQKPHQGQKRNALHGGLLLQGFASAGNGRSTVVQPGPRFRLV
jgi:hypothetical protein